MNKIIPDNKLNFTDMAIVVLLLGAAWGLFEVLLGGTIKSSGMPARAGILTGTGMFIMGISLALFRKPAVPLLIGLAAALHIQMAVPILGCSLMCRANSSLALALHGAALGGFSFVLFRGKTGMVKLAGIGFLAAGASATVFYYTGMRLAPCPYLLSFNVPGGLVSFMLKEGLVWAAFSALLMPLGIRVGQSLTASLNTLKQGKKPLHYTVAAALFIAIAAVTGAGISAGF